jgi:hypothetical protein
VEPPPRADREHRRSTHSRFPFPVFAAARFARTSSPATRFERLVPSYPDALPAAPADVLLRVPLGLQPRRAPCLLAVTLLTAAIGAFEALLFSMMAHVVDLLGATPPAELWARDGARWPAGRGAGGQHRRGGAAGHW